MVTILGIDTGKAAVAWLSNSHEDKFVMRRECVGKTIGQAIKKV